MTYSRLRQLAKDHLQGDLDEKTYRAQRNALLDGIVEGSISLDPSSASVSPGPAIREPAEDPPQPAAPALAPSRRRRLLPFFAAAAVLVAVVVLLLAGRGEKSLDSAPPPTSVGQDAGAPRGPQDLVEKFLASTSWSTASLTRFQSAWRGYPEATRRQATDSVWFRRLSDALNRQLDQELALASLNGDQGDSARVRELAAFATSLGLKVDIPGGSVGDAVQPLPAVSGRDAVTDAARTWLAAQSGWKRTLQLFALDNPDNAQRLLSQHPTLDLKILDTGQPDSRYRILYGVFSSTEEASAAYAGLPTELRPSPQANIKTFGDLQMLLSDPGSSTSESKPAAPFSVANAWVQAQDPAKFTVQVFAMSRPENVRRLLADHPELALKVFVASDPESPYRVLYGLFDSEAEAEQAHRRLPLGVVPGSATPNVKTIGELQRIATPLPIKD